jgi:hypothetical protein
VELAPDVFQHLVVDFLLGPNLPEVLNLSQFGSSLLVHLLLDGSSLDSVPLAHLHKNVGLMVLSIQGRLHCGLFMSLLLSIDISLNLILLIVSKPNLFVLLLAAEFHGLESGLIYVLHKVDSG